MNSRNVFTSYDFNHWSYVIHCNPNVRAFDLSSMDIFNWHYWYFLMHSFIDPSIFMMHSRETSSPRWPYFSWTTIHVPWLQKLVHHIWPNLLFKAKFCPIAFHERLVNSKFQLVVWLIMIDLIGSFPWFQSGTIHVPFVASELSPIFRLWNPHVRFLLVYSIC